MNLGPWILEPFWFLSPWLFYFEKVKKFLNEKHNAGLMVTPLFDSSMTQAVKNFQAAYADKVLTPWGYSEPTGLWYQSTRKMANDIMDCPEIVKLDNGKVLK